MGSLGLISVSMVYGEVIDVEVMIGIDGTMRLNLLSFDSKSNSLFNIPF